MKSKRKNKSLLKNSKKNLKANDRFEEMVKNSLSPVDFKLGLNSNELSIIVVGLNDFINAYEAGLRDEIHSPELIQTVIDLRENMRISLMEYFKVKESEIPPKEYNIDFANANEIDNNNSNDNNNNNNNKEIL